METDETWSDADSDPIADVQDWSDRIRNQSRKPKHAARFRSVPQTVVAIRWDGEDDTLAALDEMLPTGWYQRIVTGPDNDLVLYVNAGVNGAQGLVPVPIGHWIVTNEDAVADYWPVAHDYFIEKYALVEE